MGGGKWIILKLEGENREYRKLQGQNDNFPKNNTINLDKNNQQSTTNHKVTSGIHIHPTSHYHSVCTLY